MKFDALKVNNTDSFAIKPRALKNYVFFINGEKFTSASERGLIIFLKDDNLQCRRAEKELIDYRRGNETMSTECYRSKPQYYDDDSSDEDVLRAIANRKEFSAFKAHYEEYKHEDVELVIIGSIGNTGSGFIYSSIMGEHSKAPAIYTVKTTAITLDEYKLLAKEYESDAKFETPDRNSLKYVKINNNYAFTGQSFSDSIKNEVYTSLSVAKEREKEIRKRVKKIVHGRVFNKVCSPEKLQMLKGCLMAIRKSKKMKTKDEMIDILIKDFAKYISQIDK